MLRSTRTRLFASLRGVLFYPIAPAGFVADVIHCVHVVHAVHRVQKHWTACSRRRYNRKQLRVSRAGQGPPDGFRKQLSIEEVAGIPTGLSPDIKPIARRQKRAAVCYPGPGSTAGELT